jgi:HEAT repeat protein
MHAILKKLSGGDRRSIGRSNEIVADVLARPAQAPRALKILIGALASPDEVLRMRAGDAVEKITAQRPGLLQPFKKTLLALATSTTQKEVRWHLALLIPRLKLTTNERAVSVEILFDYLRDRSSIVKTFAMQSLADLASTNQKLKSQIRPLLEELTEIGTPAMRARGRKILRRL